MTKPLRLSHLANESVILYHWIRAALSRSVQAECYHLVQHARAKIKRPECLAAAYRAIQEQP